MVTDAQVRKLMKELSKDGNVTHAALKADMDRKTARRYRDLGCSPSDAKEPRTWRTRADPFEEVWPELEAKLRDAPELEAKALLENLILEKPGQYSMTKLRTLQRRVRRWLAAQGPPKRVFFAQEHVPGEAAQTDFTWATELAVTVAGVPFPHMLCHFVLPYSNWQWATICQSESMVALKHGVQSALKRLGGRTEWHQTDNSTAATHDLPSGKRKFNDEYAVLMKHVGMKPRTIAVGEKEQNGDVEALNGALKRKIKQHLLLRGSRDFETVPTYETWLWRILETANASRGERLQDELLALRPLPETWLPIYNDDEAWVSPWSTVRVRRNTYSVPSRLIGETVRVRVYDERIEVWYAEKCEASMERLRGGGGHRVDYRHVIWSLVQKPGAFARYKYREDLFPTLVFRKAYDALLVRLSEREATVQYLRILHLAASTMQADVEVALVAALDADETFDAASVKRRVKPDETVVPSMEAPAIALTDYDALLPGVAR